MIDDGTYFWPESDGWHYVAHGAIVVGPFKTFDAAVTNWREIQSQQENQQ